jgi:phage tail tape-measure protein
VTIVATGERVGDAAAAAAKQKMESHSRAVAALGHVFVPFAMEVHGHLDKSCYELMKQLRNFLPDYRWRAFTFDFLHAVSTALAAARAVASPWPRVWMISAPSVSLHSL